MNVATNSIKNKKYRFNFSSRCFKSLLEFLYTGQVLGVPHLLDSMRVVARPPMTTLAPLMFDNHS